MNSRVLTQHWSPEGTGKNRALWESSVPLEEPDKPKVIWTRVLVLCKFVTTTGWLLIDSRLTPSVCRKPACPKGTSSWEWCMLSVQFQFVMEMQHWVCIGVVVDSRHTGLGRFQTVFTWKKGCDYFPPCPRVNWWDPHCSADTQMCNLTLHYANDLKALSQQRGIKFTYTSLPHNGREESDSLEAEMVSHWLAGLATPFVAPEHDTPPAVISTLLFSYLHIYFAHQETSLRRTRFCLPSWGCVTCSAPSPSLLTWYKRSDQKRCCLTTRRAKFTSYVTAKREREREKLSSSHMIPAKLTIYSGEEEQREAYSG